MDDDRDVSLGRVIDFVCDNLPEGWTLRFNLSQGMIDIVLVNPEGHPIEIVQHEIDILQWIVDYVNGAREDDGLCAVDLDGGHDPMWQSEESRAAERALFGGDEDG